MCGICGVLNFDGKPVEPELIGRMIAMIRHRGPDEHGIHTAGNIGLGHARLSIIDLASGGQPMHNEDSSLWITFNGEIYNYLELRKMLEERGHRFATRSDTEVILHLYEEEGEECTHHLNGQWAFALWDAKAEKLFLSRDRLGVRPVFYTVRNGSFVFASEIKSIMAVPGIPRELDLVGLNQVFTFWCTIAPRTVFKGILELPPGHSLTAQEGEVRAKPHWHINYVTQPSQLPEEECAGHLRELLIDATRIRLRSDVPVGAYLSGGLDSTVIASIIRQFSDSPLTTFSVAFDDPEYDESAYQREAARFLQTDHQVIRCGYDDIARVFPDMVWHAESPVLRTAPAPLYILSSLVRKSGYKVVLTGEGSDEMLGGYDIFKETKIRRFWGAHPESKIRPLLLRRLYPYMANIQSQSDSYLRAFFHVSQGDLMNPFFSHLPRWNLTARLKLFFSEDVKSALRNSDAIGDLRSRLPLDYMGWDHFSRAQYLETRYLLPGYILSSQGDRMAMAHSVEGRFPFLDHRLVEFAAQLPPRMKMKGLNEKYILKRAASGLVPTAVLQRHKQPYRAPEVRSFFDKGKARSDYVENMLSPAQIHDSGIFNPAAVSKLVKKVKTDGAIGVKDSMALVGILSTQLLTEQFIHNFPR